MDIGRKDVFRFDRQAHPTEIIKPWVEPRISKQGWTVTWKPTTVKNTVRACMLCRGTRMNAIKHGMRIFYNKCMNCNGTGVKHYA